MEYIIKAWKISTRTAKKPAERVSSNIRIIKGYKTKSGQVPRPLLQIDAQTR